MNTLLTEEECQRAIIDHRSSHPLVSLAPPRSRVLCQGFLQSTNEVNLSPSSGGRLSAQ